MANGDGPIATSDDRSIEETSESASDELDQRSKQLQTLRGIAESERDKSPDLDLPDPSAFSPQQMVSGTEISEIQEQLGTRQIDFATQDVQKMRADEQGPFETFAKESLKLAPEIPLTAGEYAGHILDIGSWNAAYHGAESVVKRMAGASAESVQQSLNDANFEDAGNAFTKAMKQGREAVDEGEALGIDFETFREDPGATWAPFDSAWWMQHGSDLVRSVAAFGGIASAGGAATRGATSLMARAVGGGSKMRGAMQKLGQFMTSTELAQAEGMAEATQTYEQVKRKAKRAHLDQGKTEAEAIRLAEDAAGKAAATTAGITLGAIPALNYMSVLPAFRAGNKLRTLADAGLNRKTGNTAQEWLTKAGQSGMPPQFARNLGEYARESGFESLEELTNQLAQVEGSYRGEQIAGIADASTLGERISEEVISSEGALAASLGAIGGSGQRALIRNVPLHQRVGEDGESEYVSAATLQSENEMQRFERMKEAIEKRGTAFTEWQEKLKVATESGNEQELREAQENLLGNNLVKSFETGTEQQIKKLVQEIKGLDSTEAEERGFETDENSPYHYEKLADEYLTEIDELSEVWDKYQNQFNYTKEERAVNMPAQLFNIEANIRDMGRREKRVEEQIDNARSAINELSDAAKGEEQDLGAAASAVVDAKTNALSKIAEEIDKMDRVPSDFESLQDLKSEINFDEIQSEYLEEATGKLIEASPEGDSPNIPDIDQFSSYLKNSLETDTIQMMDLVSAKDNENDAISMLRESEIETQNNTYRPASSKDAANILEAEIRKQSLRHKQNLYRSQLNFLESSDGRAAYMERIKEQQARDKEERISELRDEISNLETVEEVQELRDQISPNEAQAVKDTLNTREEELRTQEKEAKREESDTKSTDSDSKADPEPEPTANPQDEDQGQTPPPPGQSTSVEDAVANDERRTEQESQDEPTGPGEPTTTTEAEPQPDTSPQTAPTPDDPGEPTTTQATPSEPSSGILGDIRSRAEDREASLPSIIRRRANDIIRNMPDPDNNDPSELSVDEWIEQANNLMDELQSEMEALAQSPQYDINISAVQDILDEKRSEIPQDAENKKLERTSPTPPEPSSGEPQNIGQDPTEAREDITEPFTQDLSPKIENRNRTINYRSRPFERNEDGEIIETANRRNPSLDKLVETDVVSEGMDLEYRIEDNIQPGQDITSDLVESAKIEVFGITENGNEVRIGALPLPENINQNNTQQLDENGNDNINKQKEKVRELRRNILSTRSSNPDTTLTGVITEKRSGHLSIKYTQESLGTEDAQADFRTLSEAFSDSAFNKDVKIYVLKDGEAHISENAIRNVSNDFTGKHSYVEGSVGVVLPTGNGDNIAIPLQIPTINNIEGLSQVLVNRVEEDNGIIDDPNMTPDQKELELSKYIFISRGGISDVFKDADSPEKVRVMKTDGGITIGRNNGGVVYTTDQSFLRGSGRGITARPVAGNEAAVQDLIAEMYLDVDLSRVNREQRMQPGKHDAGFLSQYGENLTYDDFLRQNLQTDVLEVTETDHNGRKRHIYFEQPTIMHEPTFEAKDQEGPSQQGASNREHRKPINLAPESARTERPAETELANLSNEEIEVQYEDTLDDLIAASNEGNPELYNSLRERAQMILDEVDGREGMNADSLTPLPDQPDFSATEQASAKGESSIASQLREEIENQKSTIESYREEISNLEDILVEAKKKVAVKQSDLSISGSYKPFVYTETQSAENQQGEEFNLYKLAEGEADRLGLTENENQAPKGKEGFWIAGGGETLSPSEAKSKLDDEASEVENGEQIAEDKKSQIDQFEERNTNDKNPVDIRSEIQTKKERLSSAEDTIERLEEEVESEQPSPEGEGEMDLSEFDTDSPVVEDGDVAFSTFTDTGEANDNIIEGIAARVASGESLTEAEEAIRREHSDRVEDVLEQLQTGAPIEESAQEFDPSSVDLANMQDPMARQWWTQASMEEIATHFERIVQDGRHNEGENNLLSYLIDDLFGEETWTYSDQSGERLADRLRDQARETPQSTPADTQDQVDSEIVEGSAGRWGGEADFSAGFGYTEPVSMDSGVEISQNNFEEIAQELQSEGELTITCKA